MKKVNPLDVIVFLLMFLFFYAAITKLLEHDLFAAQIGKSPLITRYADVLSWAVPVVEIGVSLLLAFSRFRGIGLAAAFCLMVMFTAYITLILTSGQNVPCSCGGVLSSLGWKEHLIFNVFFVLLSMTGVVLHNKADSSGTVKSFMSRIIRKSDFTGQ